MKGKRRCVQGGLKEEHEPDSGQCWEADWAASLAQGEVGQAEAGGGSTVCPFVLCARSRHLMAEAAAPGTVVSTLGSTELTQTSTPPSMGGSPTYFPTSSLCVSGVLYCLPKTM